MGLEADKKDLTHTRLGAMTKIEDYLEFGQEQVASAEEAMRKPGATQQDAQRLMRARQAVGDAQGWMSSAANGELKDPSFSRFKEMEIAPLMKGLMTSKREDALDKVEADKEHKKAVLEQTKNHQETMAGLARQGLAIKRDGLTASNEHKDRVAAGKVAGKKLERENLILKYEKELNDVQFQQPTITTTPEVASTFGFGGKAAVKVANPRIAVLQEAIDKLKVDSLLEEDAVVPPPTTEGDKLAKPEAVVGVREPLPSEAKGKAPGRYKLAGGDEIQVHSDGTFTALTKGKAVSKDPVAKTPSRTLADVEADIKELDSPKARLAANMSAAAGRARAAKLQGLDKEKLTIKAKEALAVRQKEYNLKHNVKD